MIVKIEPGLIRYEKMIQGLCRAPYHGHPKGCPNFGRKEGCPPGHMLKNDGYLGNRVYLVSLGGHL